MEIGNYVRMHRNVIVVPCSVIDDFVWIFPHVVLTNDPTPLSEHFVGVHVKIFATIAASSIVMPGIEIGHDSLVASGTVVTRNVYDYTLVADNPGKKMSDVRNVRNKITREAVYPWRRYSNKYMPWNDSDFLTWYETFSRKKKRYIK